MKILITGICGFTGTAMARTLQEFDSGIELWGIEQILEEIAAHGEAHPEWLKISGHA